MSGISTGVGLASGINTGQIIEQLLAIDARAKTPLQNQIRTVQAAKTAMLDVNARLLGIRSASTKFRVGRVFDQMRVVNSDESVVSATAKAGTPAGKYTFNVSRLVSTSQMLSRGFTTADNNPLGLTSMSFEFGDAAIARQAAITSLRGGQGIGQGSIRITDAAGQIATIDLGSAVTLQDIVAKINESEAIGVDASVENERIVIRNTATGSGSLVVANVGSGTVATRLGIVGSFGAPEGRAVTGAALNGLSMNSALAELNDGNGVLIRDGTTTDFKINHAGVDYSISLGRLNQAISSATKLADLNNGVGIRINTTDAADFTVVTSTGVSVGVNLGAVVTNGEVTTPAVTTVGELITRVNGELSTALGSNGVQLSLRGDGKGFVLADTLGGSGPLKVLSAGPNGENTARDLGIFTGSISSGPTTITGSDVPNKALIPRAATVQDLADRVFSQTGQRVRVQINAAGTGLRLVSTDGAAVSVGAGTVDGSSYGAAIGERTARDLGLFGAAAGSTVEGLRIASGIGTVRVANLNGGTGLGTFAPGTDTITITDRSNATMTLGNLSSYDTLESLLSAINSAAASANVRVNLSLASNGRSVNLEDTSGGGGPLIVDGVGAEQLGIKDNLVSSMIRGSDLDRQYISFATSLASLNAGKGVGSGTFSITDSAGVSANIEVDSTDTTLYDVIRDINARGLLIEASINSTGDGILLTDKNTGLPTTAMEVKDKTGTVARSLGIAKKAASPGASIDGSFERSIALSSTDTLNDLVSKIRSSGIGVTAAVINTGTGSTPFRLSLTSQFSGTRGQLLVDTGAVDLGLVRTIEGRDAAITLGGALASDTPFVFTSSSNTFEDMLSGLQVTAKKTGAVDIEVARDVDGMVSAVTSWVKAFNDTITKIGEYDKYDSTSKTKGALFGNPTVSLVRQQLITTVQSKPRGITGSFQFLSQVGVKLGNKSQLVIDDAALREAIETDMAAVQDLFAGFQVQATGSTSPVPGVTVQSTTMTYGKLGVGDTFDQLAQRLTNAIDGTTVLADRNFQRQIDALNGRITAVDTRIASKRRRYEQQFAAMEKAIARVQSQQSSVASIPSSF